MHRVNRASEPCALHELILLRRHPQSPTVIPCTQTPLNAICSVFPEAEAAADRIKEVEAARLAIDGPGEGDLGAMLAGVVDVVVLDAPRMLYEPRRGLPWGPTPTTGLTVAGTGETTDLSWYSLGFDTRGIHSFGDRQGLSLLLLLSQ